MTHALSILAPIQTTELDLQAWFTAAQPSQCYSPVNLAFIEAMSRQLLAPNNKAFPELVALGFWLREIARGKSNNVSIDSLSVQKPLGVLAHFTPANVDTMFFYSWVCGVLMGNCNLVRVATQSTQVQQRLFELLNELLSLPEFQSVSQRNLFVQYDKQSHWSAEISLNADARVIWGGDDSVNSIRSLPTKPRARDISFADRYSAAVIKEHGMSSADLQQTAINFWRDSSPFMQQACSSPRLLFWCGSELGFEAFQKDLVQASALKHPDSVQARNEQLVTAQSILAQSGGEYQFTGPFCMIRPHHYHPDYLQFHAGYLVFIVVFIDAIDAVAEYMDDKLQTLSYAGFSKSEITSLVNSINGSGLDRAVPVGHALDFDTRWDGFDLLESFSRHVTIQ